MGQIDSKEEEIPEVIRAKKEGIFDFTNKKIVSFFFRDLPQGTSKLTVKTKKKQGFPKDFV